MNKIVRKIVMANGNATLTESYGSYSTGTASSISAYAGRVGTSGGPVHIWDAVAVKHVSTLEEHTDMVSRVAFSSDGSWIASGSLDGTMRLWGVPR